MLHSTSANFSSNISIHINNHISGFLLQVLTLYSRNIFRDPSQSVQDVTVDVLLPALAQWAVSINRLTDITDDLFTALKNSVS